MVCQSRRIMLNLIFSPFHVLAHNFLCHSTDLLVLFSSFFAFYARWEIWSSGSFSVFLVNLCVCFSTTMTWWTEKWRMNKLLTPALSLCGWDYSGSKLDVDTVLPLFTVGNIILHVASCWSGLYLISCRCMLRWFHPEQYKFSFLREFLVNSIGFGSILKFNVLTNNND